MEEVLRMDGEGGESHPKPAISAARSAKASLLPCLLHLPYTSNKHFKQKR